MEKILFLTNRSQRNTIDDNIIPKHQIINTPTNWDGDNRVGPVFKCNCDLDVLTRNCTFVSEYFITTYGTQNVIMYPKYIVIDLWPDFPSTFVFRFGQYLKLAYPNLALAPMFSLSLLMRIRNKYRYALIVNIQHYLR